MCSIYAVTVYTELAFVTASRAWQVGELLLRGLSHEYRGTVNNVETVVRFARMHGDSPDFCQWHKTFLMPDTEKYIYLENTRRRVQPDEELARRLDARFVSQGRIQA